MGYFLSRNGFLRKFGDSLLKARERPPFNAPEANIRKTRTATSRFYKYSIYSANTWKENDSIYQMQSKASIEAEAQETPNFASLRTF